MENYIVSARKYRPSTFDSVVGQRALTTTLKNAIATGKLAHAYLFSYLCQDYQLPVTGYRRRGLQPMRILHGLQ